MYMASDELASRFSGIRENLRKMTEAIANGLFQDALLLAKQVTSSTRQLTNDLVNIPAAV
jgi:hypothetical protein